MAQATPQVKKIRDLRSTGMSLREIAEKLKITRKEVEKVLSVNVYEVTKAGVFVNMAAKPSPDAKDLSNKKASEKVVKKETSETTSSKKATDTKTTKKGE